MRSHRDGAATTNLDAARRLVQSLVGVLDVAFRVGADGRIEGVAILPAPGAHERQVRLNVASGLMAGFGVALDPMKVELASAPEALRGIEAAQAVRPLPPARAYGAHAGNGAAVAPSPGALATDAPLPAEAARLPQRPVLRPRVPEGAAGLAARAFAFQALNDEAVRPFAPDDAAGPESGEPAVPAWDGRSEPASPRFPTPDILARPVAPFQPEPWDDVPAAPGSRRVRLLEDDHGAPREHAAPDVRPFPAPPAEPPSIAAAAPHAQPAHVPFAGAGRPLGSYVAPARGAAAVALALPLEPLPTPRVDAVPAGRPRLDLAEVVATGGTTFCRVVITVDGETYTGVAELRDPRQDTFETVARITADALRSARIPREPIQFHGAAATDIGGRTFAIAVLRAWNGRAFDDLTGVEPVRDSTEEAAALAVLRAAASRSA